MARPALRREQRTAREHSFLAVARRLFLTPGLDGLTMERIAGAAGVAKGTVYQHFTSREDVLAALCIETSRVRLGLLERAAVFEGRSRERALAVATADSLVFRLRTDDWRTEQLATTLSLTRKISPERRRTLDALTIRSADIALAVIRDGLAAGELQPPAGLTAEKLLLGLLALTQGIYLLNLHDLPFADWLPQQLPANLDQLFALACDGFGWHPVSTAWDYGRTAARIWREVFPAEAAALGLAPGRPAAAPRPRISRRPSR